MVEFEAKKCTHEYEEISTQSVLTMYSEGLIEDDASFFAVGIGLSLLEKKNSSTKVDHFLKCTKCGRVTFEFSLKNRA